uniref:Dynein heavy chain hydrolytic ATP-binding dynein motor region domain-containing protein n=1 Tax=Amphimedon queenslandica TaxID=400682 RepID=A0A1X7TDD0_AMPQE
MAWETLNKSINGLINKSASPTFTKVLCDEQLSNQSHYDFGLRALKSVLVSAGNIKRDRIQQLNQELAAQGQTLEETDLSKQLHEQEDEVRIIFEVQDLKFATLSTVSCCGMVWFSEDVVTLDMVFDHFILKLKSIPIDEGEEELRGGECTYDQKTISPA